MNTMKSQIDNTPANGSPVRRGIVKFLLGAFAVFAAVAPVNNAVAHTNNGSKPTKLQDLTSSFTARRNQTFTFQARLYYQEKTDPHKLKPLTYQQVPVEFSINGGATFLGAVMTDKNGWARVTVPLKYYGTIPSQGRTISWKVTFRGNTEHKACYEYGNFRLMP